MKPIMVRRYSLKYMAKRKAKGRPIKIGGGDSGFITSSTIHRRMKYADESDFTPMSIDESGNNTIENK